MSTISIVLPPQLKEYMDYMYYNSITLSSIRTIRMVTVAIQAANIQYHAGEFTKKETDTRVSLMLRSKSMAAQALEHARWQMNMMEHSVIEEEEYWRVEQPCKN